MESFSTLPFYDSLNERNWRGVASFPYEVCTDLTKGEEMFLSEFGRFYCAPYFFSTEMLMPCSCWPIKRQCHTSLGGSQRVSEHSGVGASKFKDKEMYETEEFGSKLTGLEPLDLHSSPV